MKRSTAVLLALAISLPAGAQTVTATLGVKGDVRIGTGGNNAAFVPAVDNQPVVAGQRIVVGEGATATIRYGTRCSRKYSDAGVYTIEPATCRDNKDRKDQQEQQASDSGDAGDVGSVGGSSLGSTLATVLGAVVAASEVVEKQGDEKPDRAISH